MQLCSTTTIPVWVLPIPPPWSELPVSLRKAGFQVDQWLPRLSSFSLDCHHLPSHENEQMLHWAFDFGLYRPSHPSRRESYCITWTVCVSILQCKAMHVSQFLMKTLGSSITPNIMYCSILHFPVTKRSTLVLLLHFYVSQERSYLICGYIQHSLPVIPRMAVII